MITNDTDNIPREWTSHEILSLIRNELHIEINHDGDDTIHIDLMLGDEVISSDTSQLTS